MVYKTVGMGRTRHTYKQDFSHAETNRIRCDQRLDAWSRLLKWIVVEEVRQRQQFSTHIIRSNAIFPLQTYPIVGDRPLILVNQPCLLLHQVSGEAA